MVTTVKNISVTHVLYLSDRKSDSGNAAHVLGGVETQAWEILPALAKTNELQIRLIVMILHDGQLLRRELSLLEAQGVEMTAITRHEFSNSIEKILSTARCFFQLGRLLRERRREIIHLHLDHFFGLLIAWLVGCRRVVFSFHNDEPFYRLLHYRLWFSIVKRHVAKFTAISNHVLRYVERNLDIESEKLSVLPYAINVSIAEASTEVRLTRSALGLPSSATKIVGFVGRLTPQKRIQILIQAMTQLPEYHLAIIGGGPSRTDLEHLAKQLSLNNVTFCGPVERGRDAMPLLDVLCLPSAWEGLGLVLLEAMSMHIPVAGANVGAIPEVLNHRKCGELFEDVDGCVAAIRKLTTPSTVNGTESYAEQVTKLAYQWVSSNYSVAASLQAHLNLYKSVP